MKINNKAEAMCPLTEEELLRVYRKGSNTDPASASYKRILIRPSLRLGRVLLAMLITAAIAASSALICYYITEEPMHALITLAAVPIVIAAIFAKRVTIWMIMAYQRFAPASVRERCRYEPSCSQYAIAVLKRYGYFKGMYRAIRRLISCRPPNGGIDFP